MCVCVCVHNSQKFITRTNNRLLSMDDVHQSNEFGWRNPFPTYVCHCRWQRAGPETPLDLPPNISLIFFISYFSFTKSWVQRDDLKRLIWYPLREQVCRFHQALPIILLSFFLRSTKQVAALQVKGNGLHEINFVIQHLILTS